MAVPKKRTSKSKSKKCQWKNKAAFTSQKSISLAKSILSNKTNSFLYVKNNTNLDSLR